LDEGIAAGGRDGLDEGIVVGMDIGLDKGVTAGATVGLIGDAEGLVVGCIIDAPVYDTVPLHDVDW
jgi:hypothetical protein